MAKADMLDGKACGEEHKWLIPKEIRNRNDFYLDKAEDGPHSSVADCDYLVKICSGPR